jgi:tetratricopeptide (TPR) repeat protein
MRTGFGPVSTRERQRASVRLADQDRTPSARSKRTTMARVARIGIAAALATLLLVGAAVVNLGGGDRAATVRGIPTTSALLAPAAETASLDASIGALQEHLRRTPRDWRAYAALGLSYVARARITADPSWYPRAEEALRESLRIQPDDNADALLGLGALALARHEFDRALELGRRAEDVNPFDADVYGVIGDALLELGRYDEAFDAFQTMVDMRPNLASYARVSYARELLGDVAGAVDAMERAFDAAGSAADAAWAAHQLGQLAWKAGDVRTAASWYRRGLDLEPTYVANLAGLAQVAWTRGDVELAIGRYREVVSRLPSVEYLASLGDLYETTGRRDLANEQYAVVDAMRDLARANGVNVDLEIALFDADHGRVESALASAKAEWERRRSVHVADAYAWALYAKGRYGAAARVMDRALVLGTRDAMFAFHAGMIERALGHDDAAARLLRRALSINPNFSILHAETARRALDERETRT